MKKTIATKKELTTINARMLQGLHNQFGYDFMCPYNLVKIEGAFTAKKALDGVLNWGLFDNGDYKVVFLLSDRRRTCYTVNQLKAVAYTRDGFDVKCIKSDFKNGIDNFCAKCYFESARKDENTISYVLIQKARYIKPVNFRAAVPEIVTGIRYHYTEETARYFWNNGIFSAGVRVHVIGNDNKVYTLKNDTGVTHDILHFIDKSGYYVYGYKNALAWRVYNLETERARRHYAAIDNSADLERLRERIEDKKRELIAAIERATTSEDYRKIEKHLVYYRGFIDTLHSIEILTEVENEKRYHSQQSFIERRDDIAADLEKINF